LDTNNITNTGAKYLAAALRKNNTLKEARIAWNSIGNDGKTLKILEICLPNVPSPKGDSFLFGR
jgi:hypothetical protein